MRRTLPTEAEAREILSRRKTRPAPRPAAAVPAPGPQRAPVTPLRRASAPRPAPAGSCRG